MANVTDSSSLLVVPSGWSDGVLGSLKPDDGSGDFTFSRGSDLSATRVNEDGYIEKGYENLLLQSNSFDLSPWVLKPGTSLTSGIADPDGGTNAWRLNFDGTANARIEQPVSVINKGVYNFSFYGRVSSGTKNISVGAVGALTTKTLTTEWQRIELFGATTATITFPQIRSLDTSVYSIEIYASQFSQGITAQPYIETTTTTAKAATISEDQPRIDYTSGNGAVLIEPSRTNILTHSEYLAAMNWNVDESQIFQWDDSVLNPFGEYGSIKTNYTSGVPMMYTNSGRKAGAKVSISMFVKSSISTNFVLGGQTSEQAIFNALTGTLISQGDDVNSAYSVDYGNGWKRFVVNYTFQNLFNNRILYPRFRWLGNPEYVYLWGMQIEVDSTSESSYIPTYGTTATRARDTATLTKNVAATGTIFININADSAKTLTFLGGNVSVTQGVNKIALAYSPTALKISHNGSIVQNIARSLDTSSLTEIQLGHRNNFEQTTDSINQFLTLNNFLTDTELNELTA